MSQAPQDSGSSPVKVGADTVAATAGSGTFAFVIAQTLPEPYKFWLSAASPTISAISGATWVFLRVQIARLWSAWELKRAIKRAQRTLQRKIDSKTASSAQKAKWKKELEELDTMEVSSDLAVAKALMRKREEQHK